MEVPQAGVSRRERWRTAGTLTIGFGLALMVLLTFTGEPELGLALGGAVAVLGASFIFSGMQVGGVPRQSFPPMVPRRPVPPPRPPDSSSSL
jgi:hypothetical protein